MSCSPNPIFPLPHAPPPTHTRLQVEEDVHELFGGVDDALGASDDGSDADALSPGSGDGGDDGEVVRSFRALLKSKRSQKSGGSEEEEEEGGDDVDEEQLEQVGEHDRTGQGWDGKGHDI